jgi:hypothetical protein
MSKKIDKKRLQSEARTQACDLRTFAGSFITFPAMFKQHLKLKVTLEKLGVNITKENSIFDKAFIRFQSVTLPYDKNNKEHKELLRMVRVVSEQLKNMVYKKWPVPFMLK